MSDQPSNLLMALVASGLPALASVVVAWIRKSRPHKEKRRQSKGAPEPLDGIQSVLNTDAEPPRTAVTAAESAPRTDQQAQAKWWYLKAIATAALSAVVIFCLLLVGSRLLWISQTHPPLTQQRPSDIPEQTNTLSYRCLKTLSAPKEPEGAYRWIKPGWTKQTGIPALSSVASGIGADGAWQVPGGVDAPTAENPWPRFGAVMDLGGTGLTGADVITAWVYVEKSDDSMQAQLSCQIVGYLLTQDGQVSSCGAAAALTPGQWMRVVWQKPYEVSIEKKPTTLAGLLPTIGGIEVMYRADSPKGYHGAVYFDNVSFWKIE